MSKTETAGSSLLSFSLSSFFSLLPLLPSSSPQCFLFLPVLTSYSLSLFPLPSLPPSPQQRRVLDELDNRRKEDFKRYEMQMEHKRRMKLKDMDEQKRLNAEEE